MRKVEIENVTWEVVGNNEKACIEDIELNARTELTNYVITMFRQRYGCSAKITSNLTRSPQL